MPVIVRPHGDKYRSLGLRRYGLFFLDQLKHDMSFNNLEQGMAERNLPDGTRFVLHSVMGNDWIDIYTPVTGGQEYVTKKVEDVWIAFNTPARGGAWDIATAENISPYRQGIPTQTWTLQPWNEPSLEGDPVIYWWPHYLSAGNDSRFNVLKSWTYNLTTIGSSSETGWVASDSMAIFHRKSVSFNDLTHGALNPYLNSGETIDVYHNGVSVVSEYQISAVQNFYVAPSGEFTIVQLNVNPVAANTYAYRLRVKAYSSVGVLQSTTDYTSDTFYMYNAEYPYYWSPLSVAYDGSDFYCTVGLSDEVGYPVVQFTEGFIYTSATALYDYDHVERVVRSMALAGYRSGEAPATMWFAAFLNWHDFARNEFHSFSMFYNDATVTWTLTDCGLEVFSMTGTDYYTGGDFPHLHADLPVFWCWYYSNPDPGGTPQWNDWPADESWPLHPHPWNLHYTVGGYRRIIVPAG